MVDGIPMSALTIQVPEPRAVIVAVHGGGVTARYFDCPGHPRLSLMRAAASRAFTVIALDRPGYGASALYQDEMTDPSRRTELAFGAVDAIVAGDGGAGLFVMAHSSGCELGLRMAGNHTRDDVLGVELAGTGTRFAAGVRAAISQATTASRPAGLRDLLWQPTGLYPAEVLSGQLSAPGAAYEADVTTHWADRDFPAAAALVTVPVQFSVAEYERVWEATPEALADIAALFTGSPSVTVNEMGGSGHNLSVGSTAVEYHRRVLSFADHCTRNVDEMEAP
ncbi:alpha/beta fold hydrolase [Mycobacterium yunnanensis]|uniref:Alpha/beta fold hydrolase n=2 Tax=Mycobacterium yunnanensis TaxID=368477 RepID=A0A9X3C2R4_9MYCO|nr:alpha/beta fold hydrolase [Mycobacterium yunnanensis]